MNGMPIRTEIREVLDAVTLKAHECIRASSEYRQHGGKRPCDAPHYIFSVNGCVASAYRAAAEECPDCEGLLWDEFLVLIHEVAHEYKFKRITDAMSILDEEPPFGLELSEQLQVISEELLEIELRRPCELRRRTGRSRFAGRLVVKGVFVSQDSKTLMVGDKDRYTVTAYRDWCIVDRILRAVWKGLNGYVIALSTKEINALHGDCKQFVGKYIEREMLPVEERASNRQQWGDKARFKYEKLDDPLIKVTR